jgi:NitT/TauT family transport system substrate-binding protein
VALAAVAALALACSPPFGERLKLRVASVRQPATSLFFVAQRAGCFHRERLEIEEQTFDLGRDAMTALQGGSADVAIAYEAVVVRAAAADPRVRVLSTLHRSTLNTRLVARRDRGIASFSDLTGKQVGLARGTNADVFVDLALRFGGVDPSHVRVVDLAPEESAVALAAGTLDAAVLSDPVADRVEAALGGAARVLHSDLYAEFSLLTTREDVLSARAPALGALLRGLACAERAAREHPDEVLAWTAERFSALDAPTLARQLARVRWGIGLDHVLLEVLAREQERFAKGTPTSEQDVRRILAPALLEAVAPDAVMLLPGPKGPP